MGLLQVLLFEDCSKPVQNMKVSQKLKEFLTIVVVSLVTSAVTVFVYDSFFSQKVVTFDLKGYITTIRDLYISKQIDDAELRRRIDLIEEIVKSTPRRKVIITSDVILGGDRVENLTPRVSSSERKTETFGTEQHRTK